MCEEEAPHWRRSEHRPDVGIKPDTGPTFGA
jgi:hypothetical protein